MHRTTSGQSPQPLTVQLQCGDIVENRQVPQGQSRNVFYVILKLCTVFTHELGLSVNDLGHSGLLEGFEQKNGLG